MVLLWIGAAAVAAGLLWRLTGGLVGKPRSESAQAFFNRVAASTLPLAAIERKLPPHERPAGGPRIIAGLPVGTLWTAVGEFVGPRGTVILLKRDPNGEPLPAGPTIVTGAVISELASGEPFALVGDWSGFASLLNDRWLAVKPISIAQNIEAAVDNGVAAAAKLLPPESAAKGLLTADDIIKKIQEP